MSRGRTPAAARPGAERRRRTVAMLAVMAVVVLLGPVLGYVGVRAVLDSTGGRDALADNLPVQEFPSTPVGVLLVVDDRDVLAGVAVMVLAPGGTGGSVIPIPANADIGFADDARRSLQQVYAEEGPQGAVFAVESLVLVTAAFSKVVGPAELAELFAPRSPLQVGIVTPVRAAPPGDGGDGTDDGDGPPEGEGEVLIESGVALLDAASTATVLTAGAGAGDESARVDNAEAVWDAYAAAVTAAQAGPAAPLGPPASFEELLTRLGAGPVQSRGIAAIELTEQQNPTGIDVVQLDQSDAVFVFASIAPGSMSAPSTGPIMRVEAPPGYDRQVKLTLQKILFVGSNVVSVDTNAPARAGNTFVVPDAITRLRLDATDAILGEVTFEEPTFRIDGVDVTLILGTDYLESVDQ